MITKSLFLLLSSLVWVALLWLAVAPNFAKWSNLGIIAVHALPPLGVLLVWIVWRRHTLKKQTKENEACEAKTQTEREAAHNMAQQQHEEDMRQRRFGCDCRVVSVTNLGITSKSPFLKKEVQNIFLETHMRKQREDPSEESVLDQLAPAMKAALTNVYAVCGAAAAFPIFVLLPSDASGEKVLAYVRAMHTDLLNTLEIPIALEAGLPVIRFLPVSDSASNSVIFLFETAPDLPGAIVLAFDSPLSRALPYDPFFDEEPDQAQKEKERQLGKPSEGVIVLLLTNTELPSMLATLSNIAEDSRHDNMTPFWQKSTQPAGNLALLTCANTQLREELAQLPVLGRVHHAVFKQTESSTTGVLEMTRMMQNLLEQAQINAGMIDVPFALEGAVSDQPEAKPNTSRCRWLVHNAGDVDVAGKRLATLGTALYYLHIDLNPVDVNMATNIVTCVGDLGCASGVGQLALGIAHAAECGAPALCATFSEQERVAVSFILPTAK